MNHRIQLTLVCVLSFAGSLFAGQDNALTAEEKKAGWELLYDGETLEGWSARGNADAGKTWDPTGGTLELANTKGAPDIVYTEQQYENFELKIAFKSQGNSGVFFRMSSIKDWLNTGPEIQVYGSPNKAAKGSDQRSKHRMGALYDLVYPVNDLDASKETWVQFHLICAGPVVSLKVDGKLAWTVDFSDDYWAKPRGKFKLPYGTLPRKGYFMLQSHGAPVMYKNIKVRPLTPAQVEATIKTLDKSKKDASQEPPVYTDAVHVPE